MFVPIILAGGSGTRLWPLSRQQYPKQFLALDGELSMLQATVERLNGVPTSHPLVVCNEAHRFLAAEQLRQLDKLAGNVLLEPVARNTAPAIALAALAALECAEDPVLLVLAADHVMADHAAFVRAVEQAAVLAEAGALVTFGVVPTRAETGYGYIRRGASQGAAYRVAEFVEKPDAVTAAAYLEKGNYYWNSGMFMFRARRYLQELESVRPAIFAACNAAYRGRTRDLDFIRVDAKAFGNCPSESVDYAVMEHTKHALMVPLDAGWSDVGDWSALWELGSKDHAGNVTRGQVLAQRSQDNLIFSENVLVSALGVTDLVIVQTKDAVLVAAKNEAQSVKGLVEAIEDSGRNEHCSHREAYRPWGYYDSIDHGQRYHVKRVNVKPGARLSVQMHHHRAEHWIVVSGTALVTIDDSRRLLTENESVYIPLGSVHCLENPGKIPLELIEVQSGSYLGEDDIVRFEDLYGRETSAKEDVSDS